MTLKKLAGLIFFICLCSCTDNSNISQEQTNKSGISIKNSQRSGWGYVDTNGIRYTYLNITSTVTNNSALPIRLLLDFSKGSIYSKDEYKSQAFLLPKKWMTPGKYLPPASNVVLGMSNELKYFLDHVDKTSISFDTILNSREKCALTFALLDYVKIDLPYNIELKAPQFSSKTITLALSFDRPGNEHYLIPCGQIFFINDKKQ